LNWVYVHKSQLRQQCWKIYNIFWLKIDDNMKREEYVNLKSWRKKVFNKFYSKKNCNMSLKTITATIYTFSTWKKKIYSIIKNKHSSMQKSSFFTHIWITIWGGERRVFIFIVWWSLTFTWIWKWKQQKKFPLK
jgi:hypothetical protein